MSLFIVIPGGSLRFLLLLHVHDHLLTAGARPVSRFVLSRTWRSHRVLITPDVNALPHGQVMLDRAANFSAEVTFRGH